MNPEHGSVSSGDNKASWVCSKAYQDQTNAIITSCQAASKRDPGCGDYLVDLSSSNAAVLFRPIVSMKEGTSCTYRVYSKCGYPTVHWEIVDPRIAFSYDIAYGVKSGIALDQDLDDMSLSNTTTEWNGSLQTGSY